MIILYGFKTIIKRDMTVNGLKCPVCGETGDFVLGRSQLRITLFYIPIMQFTTKRFLECQHCWSCKAITGKQYRAIKKGEIDSAELNSILELAKTI